MFFEKTIIRIIFKNLKNYQLGRTIMEATLIKSGDVVKKTFLPRRDALCNFPTGSTKK